MRSKLYLDTSVINYLFADHLPFEKRITENLFSSFKAETHQGYISGVVTGEINEAPEPKRTKLLQIIREHHFIELALAEEALELAKNYITAGAMSEKHKEDAKHIAIATLNDLEALVSWNMDQIVRLHTKEVVDKINQKLGYKLIYICTPREVI